MLNPFKPNRTSHSYQPDQRISILRVVGLYISFGPRQKTGADPGFLESGFRYGKDGVRFADFISFFLNIP